MHNGASRNGTISSTLFVTETDSVNLVIVDNIRAFHSPLGQAGKLAIALVEVLGLLEAGVLLEEGRSFAQCINRVI